MTRCTWPVDGRKDRQECGHRACDAWLLDGELLPRCKRHLTRDAMERAERDGIRLVPA